MILVVMNFLKSAILSMALSAPLLSLAQDHESLTTREGRIYHEVFVTDTDANGLTFRHRDGIAKVGFASLSDSYRMLYETVEELPEEPSTADKKAETTTKAETTDEDSLAAWLDQGPVQIEARNRVAILLPSPFLRLGGGIDHGRRVPAWPTHWPDHERVHRLTHPLWRELALRDFLCTSGLLPSPFPRR